MKTISVSSPAAATGCRSAVAAGLVGTAHPTACNDAGSRALALGMFAGSCGTGAAGGGAGCADAAATAWVARVACPLVVPALLGKPAVPHNEALLDKPAVPPEALLDK